MKSIRSAANHGAPPAFPEPMHVGRPNIGDRAAFLSRVNQILDNQWLTNNGPMVQEFERRIAEHLGVRHCVAMCNGTIALEIAIRALGLKGEVIVPSWNFIATAPALSWQGTTPVFADIDPITHKLDPDTVRRMITPRTAGIIRVHLWGSPAPVEALQSIADEHGLQLMFDAAHAFDYTCQERRIGNFGRCEVLSFHAPKVFNTFEGSAGGLPCSARWQADIGNRSVEGRRSAGASRQFPIRAGKGRVGSAAFALRPHRTRKRLASEPLMEAIDTPDGMAYSQTSGSTDGILRPRAC